MWENQNTIEEQIFEFIGKCVVSVIVGVGTLAVFKKIGERKEKQLKEVE